MFIFHSLNIANVTFYVLELKKKEGKLHIWSLSYTPYVTLNNIMPPNNLLLNSYFKNLTVGLHIL